MGIILGYISLFLFIVLLVKAVAHKCHWTKIDRMLMKIHKPVSILLIITCFLHMIMVIPVVRNRSVLVTVTGILSIICMFLLIYLCHKIMNRQKRIRWHRILAVIMAMFVGAHIIICAADFMKYRQKTADIMFDDVDISRAKDGVYEGEYDVGYIYAKVRVEMMGGRIESVTLLEHRNERGKPAESIIFAVTDEQKVDVDTVSGATNSSKVIKKAIENAVKKSVIN